MKTILLVLALAAAPCLFAQVASQLHLGGGSLSVGFQNDPPLRAVEAHGRAYFAAARHPGEIAFVSTDGTSADTRTHSGGWPGVHATTALGTALGLVFYTAAQTSDSNVELRCTGPAGDLVLETLPPGSEVGTVVEMGGFAWFVVSGSGSSRLCRSDGTPGSILDMVLVPSQTRLWAAVNLRLLLTSTANGWLQVINTRGLQSDTSLIDIPTPAGTTIEFLGHWDGWVYYWLEDSTRRELHRSNGVVAETVCLLCRRPTFQGPFAPESVAHDGLMYFLALGDAGTNQLWRTNGTPQGTGPLTAQPLHGLVLPGLKVFNGAVYFATTKGDESAVWSTDGTPHGTVHVASDAGFDGEPAFVHEGQLYLLGTGLWRLDTEGRFFRRVKVQLKGSPMGRFRLVYAELGSRILLADQGVNLWVLELNAPRDRGSPAGCSVGVLPGRPALACLLAAGLWRWRRRSGYRCRRT